MNRFFSRAALVGVIALFVAANGFAGAQSRIIGKIFDGDKKPIPKAKIVITNPKVPAFKKEVEADETGVFRTLILDSTYAYDYEISAPGFVTRKFPEKKSPIGSVTEWDFQLFTEKQAQTAVIKDEKLSDTDQAILLFNEAVVFVNGKDWAKAEPKLEETVAKNPKLEVAWKALARAALEQKHGPRALEAATQALALKEKQNAELRAMGDEVDDAELGDYLNTMALAQEMNGDKDGAKKTRDRLAAASGDPAPLHNEAVQLFNGGKFKEAGAKLEKALEMKEDYAPSHYLLGIVMMNQGKNPEAKKHFQRYLEISPDGKEAEEVKAFLSYL